MRRAVFIALALTLTSTSCLGGGGEGARTVLVDFSHDEFASAFIRFFPRELAVTQGAELTFRQTWTGEPHTVTGGTIVNELMDMVEPFIEDRERGEPIPEVPPPDIMEAEERVVWAFEDDGELSQTASQPCYLSRGEPRKDGRPCRTQEQPEFTGKQSYYNSGIIPYEGPQGNEYRVKLADDIEPGSYWFYCAVHGEFQSTKVEVKPRGADVPSQAEVNVAARREIDRLAEPLLRMYREAQRRRVTFDSPEGELVIRGNFAGVFDPMTFDTVINEFFPRRMRVEAGSKITWNNIGRHTISFGVPRYFPIIEFEDDGEVRLNPRLDPPAGGARRFEAPEDAGGADGPIEFDGGTYDGTGFWSSGLLEAEGVVAYSMRITKPGTYRYACLIHPPMVGTVEVT